MRRDLRPGTNIETFDQDRNLNWTLRKGGVEKSGPRSNTSRNKFMFREEGSLQEGPVRKTSSRPGRGAVEKYRNRIKNKKYHPYNIVKYRYLQTTHLIIRSVNDLWVSKRPLQILIMVYRLPNAVK